MEFQDKNSNPIAPYATRNRDLVDIPVLWKWAAQGKIFEASANGLMDAGVATVATLDDITPTFALQSPAGATILVIPLQLKVTLTVDGNGATELIVTFTKPAGLCATSMTLSGTAMTSKHCNYRTGGAAKAAQQATALHTVTASALLSADHVEYDRRQAIDQVLTTGLIALGEGPSNCQVYDLTKPAPHILTSGAAMLVYADNTTTDALVKAYMMWAEVTEDDLV